jgi:predicted trehalose synthase
VGALADFLDARTALVHEWAAAGARPATIARRLTPDVESVRAWLAGPALPQPGSSRALVATLERRVAELAAEVERLQRAAPASDVHELGPGRG